MAGSFTLGGVEYADNPDYNDADWETISYKKGSYGYEAGTPTNLNLKYLIKGTEHTPMYYSYLNGLGGFKLDVPEGAYEEILYFIKPEKIKAGERVFEVSISKYFIVKTTNREGLTISSIAKKGKPVISGISVVKK